MYGRRRTIPSERASARVTPVRIPLIPVTDGFSPREHEQRSIRASAYVSAQCTYTYATAYQALKLQTDTAVDLISAASSLHLKAWSRGACSSIVARGEAYSCASTNA